MKIPYSYLEDEVKDGFYVDSMMKCCWAAQMNVLDKIDKICRKHGIQYHADWGTLLGTVRHGGFIPWDDDMDISMKRADYNKFTQIAEKELPEGYFFRNHKTDKECKEIFSRVVNTRRFHFEREFLEENYYFPLPAGLDIFPLDYIPDDNDDANNLSELLKNIKEVADSFENEHFKKKEFELYLQMLESKCHIRIPRGEKVIESLYDIIADICTKNSKTETKKITYIYPWISNASHFYPKEYYSKTVDLPFEKMKIPVPIAYDSMLKQKYGDYMKMVRKGGTHDYPSYKGNIESLEEAGIKFLEKFEYKKRCIREEDKETKLKLGEDNLQLLEKIHFSIYKLLVADDIETVLEMLIKSQECAVSSGEKIENIAGKCGGIITALEEYCELIFQLYQLLSSGEALNAEGMFGILQEQLQVICDAYEKEYKNKKKIVFIIDKAARWKSLESVWRAAKEDENTIVSVIVAPYCYKRFDNSIIEEHYEGEQFPDYVDIIDYKTCNLEQHHPDIIYINSPYDEYNYFTSIHQGFYSSKLINYCDKLVYIPWFVITELTREDERGWQSMQHFVTMPGVVNADQVIVQSEQMKQAYVDYLTDWAGEDTRALWEEKICSYGSPLMDLKDDRKEIEKELPESWKKYLYKVNGEDKKVILYHISSASFIDYKEKSVDKLRRVLEIFKENKEDICLLWYWDVTMEDTLKEDYPKLWEEFAKIADSYKKEAWGIYEEHQNRKLLVRLSDAYYGDGCAVSQAMVMAEKPVMLQNFDC